MLARAEIPNLLTFARVLAVPLCLALILLLPDARVLLLLVFVAASLTDYLDGYLARKWAVTSRLGALLDPIADKLLVALMLLYLCVLNIADFLPVSIILLREIYIAGLREFLANQQVALPVSNGGKWKTALQMLAVTVLLAQDAFSETLPFTDMGAALLYASALLAFISAFNYTRAAWPHLR
ncbi:MAG: CDP-diacylglycerol--glycerol-3-phosphate 3-phosphatidyltransferase [Rickettsiales bacterium]|nr:CDP-diacylglycerol--glycerol-3-phosphate 3-phosphatidyltransferase [Rickettsiales bacterium]